MIMREKEKKIRITLDVSPQFFERLEQWEETVDADSKASLVRQAIQLYGYLAEKAREGAKVCVVTKDGEKETPIFLIGRP